MANINHNPDAAVPTAKPDATAVTSGSSGSEAIIAYPSTETKATAGPSNISK